MSLNQAMFILRHGSAEGEHKYFKAIDRIEKEINRQKAEIERLKSMNQSKLDMIHDLRAEIENTQKLLQATINNSLAREDLFQFLEAEAIKEVAEVLEAELESANKYIREYDDSAEQRAYTKGLHNAWSIVKEMAGERE